MAALTSLGFINKDNEYSNLRIDETLSVGHLSVDSLDVGTINIANTTVSSSAHNFTVLNDLTVNNQLVFPTTGSTGEIIFQNAATGASITIACHPTSVPGITYNIPDVGVNFSNFVMTDGAQTINGQKTFTTAPIFPGGGSVFPVITVTNTSNQIVLGNGGSTVTLSAPAPAGARTYTIPDSGANSSFVLTDGAQILNGSKTFSSAVTINPTTNQIVLGVTNTTTITSPAPAASRVYTIPDAGANSQFVMTNGNQTISGLITFTQAPIFPGSGGVLPSITLTNTTNQITLGTTNTVTISSTPPSASRTCTIPDPGGSANFILSTAIAGTTTNAIQFGNATASYVPTSLNYYEVVTSTITYGGSVLNLPQTGNITFVRIGAMVNVTSQGFLTATSVVSNSIVTSQSNCIPTRFIPKINGTSNEIIATMQGQNNGSPVSVIVGIETGGQINLYNSTYGSVFTGGGGQIEIFSWCMSWSIS